MSSVNLAVPLVLGLLLFMAQQSMQTRLINPIAEIETSNCKITFNRLGLVFPYDVDEQALLDSGLYKPDKDNPYVDHAGRRFHIGSLNNTPIIYVNAGNHSINVATALQSLFDRFRVFGIIFFVNAGSLDEKILEPGDVVVPESVAFTGIWDWKQFGTEVNPNEATLVFRDFNSPRNVENLLAHVEFNPVTLFSQGGKTSKNLFRLPISSSWYRAATQVLKDLKLRPCYNGVCVKPKVVFGSSGSTSDFFVRNKAYGNFLRDTFKLLTIDRASASVALTCLSNEKLFVVFQGVSNVVGGNGSTPESSYLSSYNAFLAATKFINSIPTPRIACE